MKNKIEILLLRLKVSALGVMGVLKKPQYLAYTIIFAFVSSSFILWSLNLDLVSYILFDAPISVAEKINFFGSTYNDIFTTYNSNQAMGILLFSILFGVNISMLIYVVKNHGFANVPKKSGALGFVFAVLSGGCIACGTSLLAPVLATFGAVSSTAIRDLSLWLNWIGSILILFSIYKLGQLAKSTQF